MQLKKKRQLSGTVFCMGLVLFCLSGCDNTSTSTPDKITGSKTLLLNVSITGTGNVYYRGNPTIIKDITGSGSLIDGN